MYLSSLLPTRAVLGNKHILLFVFTWLHISHTYTTEVFPSDHSIQLYTIIIRGITGMLAVVTLPGFVLGKLDLLTVSLGKLKFASVTDFSLSKLPRESFIVWGSKTAREQKNVLWISLDNYPKAEKGKNQIPE